MKSRSFGPLGAVSALTLGGGGIGGVYGGVDPDEAVATVRAAVDGGITLLDLAPTYGPGETSPAAELVVARAFSGRIPADVRVTSKVLIEDPSPPDAIRRTLRESLRGSLERLGRDHLDVYILHSYIRPSRTPPLAATADLETVREVVRPELERLVEEGTIACWGMTGTAAPDPVCEVLEDDPAPAAVQCVTNALDATGDLWPRGLAGHPDNERIRRVAAARGVAVMGIRALAAGALSDGLDRAASADDPAAVDARRAGGFRALAREYGMSPALLAHRYALSLRDVATLVIGAKTRRELAECLAAEAAGPLSSSELSEIEACSQGLAPA
jgi:aryl-alcohol dehydrogenase-like predicted oxidoreductase